MEQSMMELEMVVIQITVMGKMLYKNGRIEEFLFRKTVFPVLYRLYNHC